MKLQSKTFMYSLAVVALIVTAIFIVLSQSKSKPPTNTRHQQPQTEENTLYVHKLISGQESRFIVSTQPQLLISSLEIRSERVGELPDLNPMKWWMQNISVTDKRWLLLIPRTMESRPEARLIDLEQQKTEQGVILPFVQTGDIENSNYGDIIVNGFYDSSQQAIIYLVRKNVMTATEGTGIAEKTSVAEIWSQPVTGGGATLMHSANAEPLALQNEEAQYDLPESIQPAKNGVYRIWRSKVEFLSDGEKNAKRFFQATLDKDQTSVFVTLHIGPTGEKVILEQQDRPGIGTTNLYRLGTNDQPTLVRAFDGAATIGAWYSNGTQMAVSAGESGTLSTLEITTGQQTAFTFDAQADIVPLFVLNDADLFTTSLSSTDTDTGWYTTLGTYDVVKGESTSIPIQGRYLLLQ